MNDFSRILRQKSKEERAALLDQARDEALAEELAEAREQSEREAAALREELAYDPAKERDRARETAKSAALLLIMLLLILLLIAAATGRTDILPIPGAQVTQTLQPYISGAEPGAFVQSQSLPTAGPAPEVDAVFQDYYYYYLDRPNIGDTCSIGNPISSAYTAEGVRYQWFQRALLKTMPVGYVGDSTWSVQGERLGSQVTSSFLFPTAQPFLSQPGAYYFGETGHAVNQQFLDFWRACDGLHLLGYPISDIVYEVLTPDQADQQPYQVQYFERGRLEYHQNDPNRPVQFGLLGLIKSKDKDFQANIVMPPQPGAPAVTAVPHPAATPTPVPIITAVPPPAATSALPPAATAVPIPVATSTPPPAATAYPGP